MKSSQRNLLLVDDDPTFCEVLSHALLKQRFRVRSAASIGEAEKLLQDFLPGYAIVDLRIGRESGLLLVKILIQQCPGIRIVMLTGYASVTTAVEAIKLGAVHYLTKPASVKDIVDAFGKTDGNEVALPADTPLSVKRLEWEHIQKVLHENAGNISATARSLGMHRRTLQRKLQKRPRRG